MKISNDKLKLFTNEGDLTNYLKTNGLSGTAVEEHIAIWKKVSTEKSVKKTAMITPETDKNVEIK